MGEIYRREGTKLFSKDPASSGRNFHFPLTTLTSSPGHPNAVGIKQKDRLLNFDF